MSINGLNGVPRSCLWLFSFHPRQGWGKTQTDGFLDLLLTLTRLPDDSLRGGGAARSQGSRSCSGRPRHRTAWCARAEKEQIQRGDGRRSPWSSGSHSGFVKMKYALGFAKDKSRTFAYKFQRTEAIRNFSAGPARATISLPPSEDDSQGFSSSGDLGRGAGSRWQV